MSQHSRTGAARPAAEWIPKAEAAKLLQTSTRQIERRVAQGMIQSRTLDRLPGSKAGAVEYSRSDVDALLAGRPNNHARIVRAPEQLPAKPAAAIATSQPPRPQLDQLAAALAAIASSQRPAEPKPWLTLKEAAEYSGLPESWLLKQARLGPLSELCRAVNVAAPGSKYERWRFSRRSLTL